MPRVTLASISSGERSSPSFQRGTPPKERPTILEPFGAFCSDSSGSGLTEEPGSPGLGRGTLLVSFAIRESIPVRSSVVESRTSLEHGPAHGHVTHARMEADAAKVLAGADVRGDARLRRLLRAIGRDAGTHPGRACRMHQKYGISTFN